jgi:hypothetical protein
MKSDEEYIYINTMSEPVSFYSDSSGDVLETLPASERPLVEGPTLELQLLELQGGNNTNIIVSDAVLDYMIDNNLCYEGNVFNVSSNWLYYTPELTPLN